MTKTSTKASPKIWLALVTAILAATTLLASTAEAGMKVRLQFGYPLGSFTAHGNSGASGSSRKHRRTKRHHHVRRKAKSKVRVTKKPDPAEAVAKAQPDTEIEKAKPETENSSISTAAAGSAKETGSTSEPAADEPKASKNVDCKQFFPSVGMTLTVPCK